MPVAGATNWAWWARLVTNLEATASSWRTWLKLNARRNEPNLEGAYALAKAQPIAP